MDVNLFKDIRYYVGKSQRDFAEWIGVSPPTVALFEAGHRNMSDVTRAKLAHKFDINDSEFQAYRKRKNDLKGN